MPRSLKLSLRGVPLKCGTTKQSHQHEIAMPYGLAMTNKYCHTVSKRVVSPYLHTMWMPTFVRPRLRAGALQHAGTSAGQKVCGILRGPARHCSRGGEAGGSTANLYNCFAHAQEITRGGHGHVEHEGE